MDAGKLRHRVTLQRPVEAKKPSGARVNNYEDVVTVWASVEPLRGEKFFAAQQVQSKNWAEITIRHRRGVRKDWRIRHIVPDSGSPEETHYYEIEEIDYLKNRNVWLKFTCVEREADGFRT